MDTPPDLPPESSNPPTSAPQPIEPSTISTETDRSWCIGLHLSGLIVFLVWGVGHILAPLIIWLIKRSDSPLLDATGKEVLNFQISYSIYLLISWVLCLVLIGFLLLPALFVAWVTLTIIAAVKTSNGETYRYPGIIRFLR